MCANPANLTYEWTREEGDLGRNITGADTDTLVITGVGEEDFGNYTCGACNSINTSSYCADLMVELVPYGMLWKYLILVFAYEVSMFKCSINI